MASSEYTDRDAGSYVVSEYYHWIVMIPVENITQGFHTEEELTQYIQQYGIDKPDWVKPDEAFNQYIDSGGRLEWIPECPLPTEE
jgi:hypothetical protein